MTIDGPASGPRGHLSRIRDLHNGASHSNADVGYAVDTRDFDDLADEFVADGYAVADR